MCCGLKKLCKKTAKENKVSIKIKQNNCEGKIVTIIQKSLNKYSCIIINAGAYTHTSIAILDALKSVSIPVVEVHITDIATREEFRKHSYISMVAKKIIKGKGMEGYKEAIEFFNSSENVECAYKLSSADIAKKMHFAKKLLKV